MENKNRLDEILAEYTERFKEINDKINRRVPLTLGEKTDYYISLVYILENKASSVDEYERARLLNQAKIYEQKASRLNKRSRRVIDKDLKRLYEKNISQINYNI